MITLLTGKPGTGKTAYAVKMLLEDKTLEGRPVFTNITGLTLPHFPIDAEWLRSWHRNAPPEAFILYDECQDVFMPRHASREPPDFINELTKHRKDYSVDFFLITQKASFIDHMVRGLTQRHIHIRETGLSRMVHEAPEVLDFDDKSVREAAASSPYVLPKQVFDLYTSAQVHTKKQRRRLPLAVYVFFFAITLALGLGVYVYKTRISPAMAGAAVDGEQSGGVPPPARLAADLAHGAPDSILEAVTPADPYNPLSAPLYAAVVPPVVAPEIVGCIASSNRCTCYTQQATTIWVPGEQCRQRAAGLYYDPYRQPPPESQTRRAQAPRSGSEATAPKGFEPRPLGPDPRTPSPPPAGESQV